MFIYTVRRRRKGLTKTMIANAAKYGGVIIKRGGGIHRVKSEQGALMPRFPEMGHHRRLALASLMSQHIAMHPHGLHMATGLYGDMGKTMPPAPPIFSHPFDKMVLHIDSRQQRKKKRDDGSWRDERGEFDTLAEKVADQNQRLGLHPFKIKGVTVWARNKAEAQKKHRKKH